MNQICAKIYYSVINGEVLCTTSEMEGSVESTTKEQDMAIYSQLKDKNIDEVEYLELEYGTLGQIFKNAKSFTVNINNKQLEVIYYTNEELTSMQVQYQEVQDLNSRVSDISTYLLSSDSTTIADIENSILEIEKNKIINGGM
jgi:hypothetical protein